RHIHEVAARQAHLTCKARALVAHWVFRHLNEHLVARLEREFDAAGLVAAGCLAHRIPVHLARVQHRVAAPSDIDERRLHARQHVLHAAQLHLADERSLLHLRYVTLRAHVVLRHTYLDAGVLLAHLHDSGYALASSKELRLGDHGATKASVTTVT